MTDSIIQGAVAIVVLLGCFGLIFANVLRGQAPDPTVVAFASPIAGLVVGWYFTQRATNTGADIANTAAAAVVPEPSPTPAPAPPK